MVEADLDRVLTIERLSFSRPWEREHFLFEIRQNTCAHNLVLRFDNEIIAYAIAWIRDDELSVARIAVDPRWRRRGFARELMERLLQEGVRVGCAIARLEVREDAVAAVQLYRELGFTQEGRRTRYYEGDDADALLMALSLGASGRV